MTEDRNTATAQRGPRTNAEVLERVLQTARSDDYEGYSKHDGLNSPLLAALGGQSRLRRLAAIQVVTRSPIDIRPLAGVRKARNAKGLSLFSRALLARHRMTGSADDAAQARGLLDWLIAHPAPGFEHLCWGYPYPVAGRRVLRPAELPQPGRHLVRRPGPARRVRDAPGQPLSRRRPAGGAVPARVAEDAV